MELPVKQLALIEEKLNIVRQNPLHNLNPLERVDLYKSFGPSRLFKPDYIKPDYMLPFDQQDDTRRRQFYGLEFFNLSFADYVIYYLAFITVNHVLFVWERYNINNPGLSNKEVKDDFF